ncbi:Leucine-rich repeat-containing protein 28 [Branchiostoma belcheri]|nr:Leucine-rich repeat-containing protein 28 [Branchiostoma belcheri]
MAAGAADVHGIVTQARRERHLILNLNYSHLSTLPAELMQGEAFTFLERLFVKRNVLVSLPFNIAETLPNLVELYLHSNNLVALPDEIGNLQRLKSLDVSCNNLQVLTPAVGRLQVLQMLHLADNSLLELPAELGQLKKLQTLDVMLNRLAVLPRELCGCEALQCLMVDRNRLISLPRELVLLQRLSELSAASNQLTYLPADLGWTDSLQYVYVDKNANLRSIPVSLWLKVVGCNGCGVKSLTEEDDKTERRNSFQCGKHTSVFFPPEIRTIRDAPDPCHVSSLLELSLRVVHDNQRQGVVVSQEDLPPDLHSLVTLPSGHCCQCCRPFFTQVYAKFYPVRELDAENNLHAGSELVFLASCCSKTCLLSYSLPVRFV